MVLFLVLAAACGPPEAPEPAGVVEATAVAPAAAPAAGPAAPMRPAPLDRACPSDLEGARRLVRAGGGPCVALAPSPHDPACVDGPHHLHGHDNWQALARTCDDPDGVVVETVVWEPGVPARVRVERAPPAAAINIDPRGKLVVVRREDGVTSLYRWSDLDALRVIGAPLGPSDWNGVLATELWARDAAWTVASLDALAAEATTTPGGDLVRYRVLWDVSDPTRPRAQTVGRY